MAYPTTSGNKSDEYQGKSHSRSHTQVCNAVICELDLPSRPTPTPPPHHPPVPAPLEILIILLICVQETNKNLGGLQRITVAA